MKHHITMIAIAVSLLLAGCGVGAPFIQPGAYAGSPAHIVTDSDHTSKVAGWDRRIYIQAVDGNQTRHTIGLMPEEAYLTAGPHRIDVIYMFMGSQAKGHLQLVALHGHDYVIHRQEDGNRMRFWITDGWSGPVVGGIVD